MGKKLNPTSGNVNIERPVLVRLPVHVRSIPGTSYVPNQVGTRDVRPGVGKGKRGRDVREDDREATARECLYLDDDGRECIPGAAFMKSMLQEAKSFKTAGLSGAYVAGSLQVAALLIPIKGKWVVDSRMARRPARTGAPCLIHRPRYDKWEAEFDLVFDSKLMSQDLALNLLANAGAHIGIGDGRKQNGGPFGGLFELVE